MTDEIEVTVAFNGPDEYQAYNDAPACLRELISRQARELAEAASALRSSGEASAWRPKVEDFLHRLATMQPPNVVLQQITMLGEARDLLREAITLPTSTKA